jgi:uncharacterized cupin superfamily protein
MTLMKPALDPATIEPNTGSGYPEPFRSRVLPRERRALGDVTDAGEQRLTPGTCAGFKAGSTDGHQLVNRGAVPAVYLEIGNRDTADRAVYPDVDLLWNPPGAPDQYTHRDLTPY